MSIIPIPGKPGQFLNREIRWCRHLADEPMALRPATANEVAVSLRWWQDRRSEARQRLADLSNTRARRSRRQRRSRRMAGRAYAHLLAQGPSSKRMNTVYVEFTIRLADWRHDAYWGTVQR
jgi:hypothetical protein